MGRFVESDPEAELRWTELELALHGQDIGSDEHHSVAVTAVGSRQDQFVLTQHASRQKAKHRTEFGRHDAPGQPPAHLAFFFDAIGDRSHQLTEGGDIVLNPLSSAHHCNIGAARSFQPSFCGHERGGSLHQQRCLARQTGLVIGAFQWIAARKAAGHGNSGVPGGGRHGKQGTTPRWK